MMQLIDWETLERDHMTPMGFKIATTILVEQVWREYLKDNPTVAENLEAKNQPEVDEFRTAFGIAFLAGVQLAGHYT